MAVVHEVIIIGAGIAGLAAAAKLAPRFSRNDVLILEGSSRIGGRLRSEHWENADVCIERGANWVHGYLHPSSTHLKRFTVVWPSVCEDPAPNSMFMLR